MAKIKVWDWYIEIDLGEIVRVNGKTEGETKCWRSFQVNRQKIDGTEREVQRMTKVWDWYVEYCTGSIVRIDGVTEQWLYNCSGSIGKFQKIDGTEREVE